jgi:hypothetical protein
MIVGLTWLAHREWLRAARLPRRLFACWNPGTGWREVKTVERSAYTIAVLLILSGLVHLAVLLMTGGSWEGPLSLRKPTTFGLSFGLTLINVTSIASFLSLKERTHSLLIGVFSAACVLETFLVSMQAWRGVPSHFNMETPFDAAVAQTLAAGGFTLVVVIVILAVMALRDRSQLPHGLRLAIQAGLVALVAAQIVGGVMIATGVRLVFKGDPQLAYATGGWLKPAHAALMHGILVLPLLAWWLSRTGWNERSQIRAVWTGIGLYAFVVLGAVVASVLGTA